MKLRATLVLVALVAVFTWRGQHASAEELQFAVTLDPARATVGDQLTLTILVTHAADSLVAGPAEREAFLPLELVEVLPTETLDADSELGKTRFQYVLAAFETGEIQPPEIEFQADDGTSALAQLPAVTIESVLPDEGVADLRDVRGPVAASGPPRWLWAALIMFAFAALTVITMFLIRPTLMRPTRPEAPVLSDPPDVKARRELESISAAAAPSTQAELAEYYGRIASCLREYLSRRFNVPAVAMTPSELEDRLAALEIDPWPVRLAVNLLQQCEAAQFAQYEPAEERAEADLATAFEIVELTAEPEEAAVS